MTALIDGCGSCGAALGPLLTGVPEPAARRLRQRLRHALRRQPGSGAAADTLVVREVGCSEYVTVSNCDVLVS